MTDDSPQDAGALPRRKPGIHDVPTMPAKNLLAEGPQGSRVAPSAEPIASPPDPRDSDTARPVPAPQPLTPASPGPTPDPGSSTDPSGGAVDSIQAAPEGTFKALRTNRQFGRYELLLEVSAGGMATLYLARLHGPESFEKVLAIKRIHDHLASEKEFVDMFLDEARIAARIQHPHVATIFDMGREDGSYYIAMEYVHGNNLGEILREAARRRAPLPWDFAARIVADAAWGLHAAHDLKTTDGRPLHVVHRDVSPQNLLVSYEGHVKVVDFGIAAAAEKSGHTRTGVVKGKAAYMSPEQVTDQPLDRRSDIFSLGVVLWEAVCLRRLFRRKTEAETLLAVRDEEVPRPTDVRPSLPQELERILLKALARRPEDRFATAAELAERLEALLVAQRKSVTPTNLSRLLEDLFRDRIKAKDILVRQALQSTSGGVLKSISAEWTTGTGIELADQPSDPAGRRRVRRLLTTAGVVCVAALAIGLGIHLTVGLDRPVGSSEAGSSAPDTSGASTASPARTREPAEPRASDARRSRDGRAPAAPGARKPVAGAGGAARPNAATVELRLEVEPRAAEVEVLFRGRLKKGNPFTVLVPRSERPESIEIRAPGFATQSFVLIPLSDLRRSVTLQAEARRALPTRPIPRREEPLLEDLPE